MEHLFIRLGNNQGPAVTLVDVPMQLTISEAAEQLYSENPLHLAYTDILVVRHGVSPSEKDDVDSYARDLLKPFWAERAPQASLHLLYVLNYELKLTKNCNPNTSIDILDEKSHVQFIEQLRNEELKEFIRRSSALFYSKNNFVYRSPSGQYCSAFLRVGNVQMGKHQLDAFAFWLMPHLKGVEAVIIDTWSISSLTLNAMRLLELQDHERTSPIDMDMLSCYQDGTSAVTKEMHDAVMRVSHNGHKHVLFLVSTVMTGESLRRFRAEICRLGLNEDNFNFLTLYKLSTECQIACLCDLSNGLNGQCFDAMNRPPENAAVVEIDPHTYFPLHIEESLIRLGKTKEVKSNIDMTKDFIDAYQGSGVISVHRNATDLNKQKLRHHAIYIDVCEMLNFKRFKDRLVAALMEYEICPKAIITPPHGAGLRLAEEVNRILAHKFGTSPKLIVHPDLHPDAADVPVDYFKSCDPEDVIIILDDVSATGIRLSRYQSHLRNNYKGRIDYIVGVARPESDAAWERRKRDLRYRAEIPKEAWHRVTALEYLILPDWSEKDCPWCQELELLEKISRDQGDQLDADMSKHLSDRRRMLLNALSADGITSEAFWCFPSGKRPTITNNSIFLNNIQPTDADVFASVASVVQHFRKVLNPGLRFSYPHLTIIDPSDYLDNTFNDVMLRFAIIRCAKRNELKCWKDQSESDRRSKVERLLLGKGVDLNDREPLMLEFALAIAGKKLPEVFFDNEQWESLGNSPAVLLLRCLHRG